MNFGILSSYQTMFSKQIEPFFALNLVGKMEKIFMFIKQDKGCYCPATKYVNSCFGPHDIKYLLSLKGHGQSKSFNINLSCEKGSNLFLQKVKGHINKMTAMPICMVKT